MISSWSRAEKVGLRRGIVGLCASVTIVREGNLSAEGVLAFDILAISCQASPLLLRGIPKPTSALTLARSGILGSDPARKPADENIRLEARRNGVWNTFPSLQGRLTAGNQAVVVQLKTSLSKLFFVLWWMIDKF